MVHQLYCALLQRRAIACAFTALFAFVGVVQAGAESVTITTYSNLPDLPPMLASPPATNDKAKSKQHLAPRVLPVKPSRTVLTSWHATDQVAVKFRKGSGVEFTTGRFATDSLHDLSDLTGLLSAYLPAAEDSVQRIFNRPRNELDAERSRAQQLSGRELADLNLYFRVDVPPGVDIAEFCDNLNTLPYVELATPALKPAPLPVDIAPSTGEFSGAQGYHSAAPFGIGTSETSGIPGSDGAGTQVVDVEYSWVMDHEDLELNAVANIDSATADDPYQDEGNHGTAVLGIIGAQENHYGVSGIAPGTTLRVAPANTHEYGYSIERAISLATSVLKPGDVILLEQQAKDGRFGAALSQSFALDLDWNADLELRSMDFQFSGRRIVRMFHTTDRTDDTLRFINYKDPDTGTWNGWIRIY